MKKIIASAGLSLLVVVLVWTLSPNNQNQNSYKQRDSKFPVAQSWSGAAQYYHRLRRNPETGEVSIQEVLQARKQALLFNQAKSGTTFAWEEMGPDNYGGRTRAILVDKTDPTGNRIYAGGVSGGLFVSNNGGGQWQPVQLVSNAVAISAIAQGPDGKIWIGTGATFDIAQSGAGDGGSGFVGSGLYTLEPGSTTIQPVASAQPSTFTGAWSEINAIAFKGNSVYVGTNQGLRKSDDGGITWTVDAPQPTRAVQDLHILSDGSILTVLNTGLSATNTARLYRNETGESGAANYQYINSDFGFDNTAQRIRLAVSPTNEQHIYAVTVEGGSFDGFYESTNGGASWTKKSTLSTFNPFSNQGFYDLMVQVDPQNENICYIGGIDIWKYNNGSFTHLTDWSTDNFNPWYVHADQHSSTLSHADNSLMYFGCDGGIFRTFNGGDQFIASNRGFNVTQFYSVAYSEQGWALGGTQDNGSIGVSGLGFYPLQGTFAGGGDGFDAEFSNLTDKQFTTVYGGAVRRGTDNSVGGSFCGPWSCGEEGNFTFYTNIGLWESHKATDSKDSILFKAEDGSAFYVIGISDGVRRTYTGTIAKPQSSGNFVPGSVKFTFGTSVIQDTGTVGTLTGNGTGTFNYATGAYNITFTNAPSNQVLLRVSYSMFYNAGSTIAVSSTTPGVKLRNQDFVINHTLTTGLQPGDSVRIQDPVQSLFVYGAASTLYVTRDGLRDNETEWWTLTGMVSGEPNCMDFSKDGNHIFVGTSNGRVYRVSGFNNVYTAADAKLVANGGALTATLIANEGSSKTISGISVDKTNANNVVFTVAGYGNHTHVLKSTSAATTTSENSFTAMQGDLPNMPVYDVVISNDASKHVVIGTEFGVYSSLFATSGSWTNLNNGLPNVPVFAVRQQTNPWEITDHTGVIYLGTHGRGIWKSGSLTTSVSELPSFYDNGTGFASELNVYPNPANNGEAISIGFKALANAVASVRVYDLTGKLVEQLSTSVSSGDNLLELKGNLSSGTYVVSVALDGKKARVAKIVVY